MAERSVFEKLAETLPEKERKDLLEKITRSMNFQQSADESIYHKEMSSDERERLIQQDMGRLSVIARLLMWLKGAVTGRSRKDLLIATKVRLLKSAINRTAPGLTGFETRDLTPKLAEAFYRLYLATLPVKAIYRRLMLKTREIEGAFVDLCEERIPDARVQLTQIVSMDELQDIFESTGAEAAVKREVLGRLEEYIKGIDDLHFATLEDDIVPLFFLKDIVLFPYSSFFELFRFSLEVANLDEPPFFKAANAMLSLEYLEKMYFAVYAALKIPQPFRMEGEILKYVSALGEESAPSAAESKESDNSPDATPAADPSEQEGLAGDFKALYEEVRRFEHHLPLAELIRFFLKDPYYKLWVYVPRLHLRDYFAAMLKVRFIAELSTLSDTLKMQVVERRIRKLFGAQQLIPLQNYREYKSVDFVKMGIPLFTRTRSLNLLYNFIRWYYRDYVQEVVKNVSNVVLVQNRITRNKLLQHASAVEDLEQKILEFDGSLGPDADEGKAFHKLRVAVSGDTSHQRALRTIVLQKDAAAIALIERGRENLTGLLKVFDELTDNQSEAIKERLEARYYINGKLLPLSQTIEERRDQINSFVTLLIQLIKSEGG